MKHTLESEYNVVIKWLYENKMIVNPDKLQARVLDKRRSNDIEAKFTNGSEQIQVVPSVDILGITIYDKLNFNLHIDKIYLKFSNQPNVFARLKHFLRTEERKVLTNKWLSSFKLQFLSSGLDVNKCEICTKN